MSRPITVFEPYPDPKNSPYGVQSQGLLSRELDETYLEWSIPTT